MIKICWLIYSYKSSKFGPVFKNQLFIALQILNNLVRRGNVSMQFLKWRSFGHALEICFNV